MSAEPPPGTAESALAQLLAFHVEAGVDCALEETQRNFLREGMTPETSEVATTVTAQRPLRGTAATASAGQRSTDGPTVAPAASRALSGAAARTPEEAVALARRLATAAPTLEALRQAMDGFDGCALKATARQLCFADGNPSARIMLIGEAPGAEEDASGIPFVGRSGQLLTRMLAAIGLDRASDVYIANVVPWRPPGNRTPTAQELAICLPFIQRQIALAGPDLILTLGAPAAQALLGVKGIVAERGKWRSLGMDGRAIPALPTFHPAFVLRQPLQKRAVWQDLLTLRAALEGLPARP